MIGLALLFLVLLALEWRYKFRSLRVGIVTLAVLVWLFAQPGYTTAARRVINAPPEARVTQLRGAEISDYESGVTTMYEAIDDIVREGASLRLLALAVLIWLAVSPVLGRAPAGDRKAGVASVEPTLSA